MKILVIGHLCLDVIHPVDGPQTESYGGIYYSVITLASLLNKSDTVIPVFGVHKNDYQSLIERLAQFPNIDPSGIFKFEEPTNRVHLYYKNQESRIENSKNIAKPIPYSKIRRHLSGDGILVNMISGFDIELETLDHIRMAIRSHGIPIHLDIHSLTLGVNESNERFRKPVENWRRWAFMIDTVQLNEEEIQEMPLESLTEAEVAGHLLTLGVKGAVVTRGPRGATVYTNEKKHVLRKDIPGIHVETIRDTTGCGDIFGAAFFCEYVRSRDLFGSAELANKVAASRVQGLGAAALPEQIGNIAAV